MVLCSCTLLIVYKTKATVQLTKKKQNSDNGKLGNQLLLKKAAILKRFNKSISYEILSLMVGYLFKFMYMIVGCFKIVFERNRLETA